MCSGSNCFLNGHCFRFLGSVYLDMLQTDTCLASRVLEKKKMSNHLLWMYENGVGCVDRLPPWLSHVLITGNMGNMGNSSLSCGPGRIE